jgi:hypothetical protein
MEAAMEGQERRTTAVATSLKSIEEALTKVEIVAVMMTTKVTDVGLAGIEGAEMTVKKVGTRNILSTRCQD